MDEKGGCLNYAGLELLGIRMLKHSSQAQHQLNEFSDDWKGLAKQSHLLG
jgi:hypothetical protein